MTKRALITGITGQDGAYLAKLLLEKGYEVYGTFRRASSPNFWRLQYLGIFDKVNLVPCELTDATSIFLTIKEIQPDEIYHLGAMSFVGASFENPVTTFEIPPWLIGVSGGIICGITGLIIKEGFKS